MLPKRDLHAFQQLVLSCVAELMRTSRSCAACARVPQPSNRPSASRCRRSITCGRQCTDARIPTNCATEKFPLGVETIKLLNVAKWLPSKSIWILTTCHVHILQFYWNCMNKLHVYVDAIKSMPCQQRTCTADTNTSGFWNIHIIINNVRSRRKQLNEHLN
jgi:hypothetical protein